MAIAAPVVGQQGIRLQLGLLKPGRLAMHRHAILPVLTVAMMSRNASSADAQQSVTFVSATGSDASPDCSFAAPCQSFQSAHDKTLADGTIYCRDTDIYGRITITKSITIDCGGVGG